MEYRLVLALLLWEGMPSGNIFEWKSDPHYRFRTRKILETAQSPHPDWAGFKFENISPSSAFFDLHVNANHDPIFIYVYFIYIFT